jgi:hypothetical protein
MGLLLLAAAGPNFVRERCRFRHALRDTVLDVVHCDIQLAATFLMVISHPISIHTAIL